MRASGSHPGRTILVGFALYGTCALGTHASGLWQPMHADYSCWLRVARDWRQGVALYRDTYDNKSPWVYRWVQVVDSSRPEVSAYLAECLLAAAAAALLRAALQSSFPRTALLPPLLLIAWSGASQTFYGGQTTEAICLWWDVAAISCWVLAARQGAVPWAMAAGACSFVVIAFRPPAAIHILTWLPFAWLLFRQYPSQTAWKILAAACCGWLAMLGLFWLDAARGDYWTDFLTVLGRNQSYAALERAAWPSSLLIAAGRGTRVLADNPVAVVFLVMSAGIWWRPTRRIPVPQKCWCIAAIVWWGAALAGAMPGGRHYLHYYHLIWPPTALIAALWLAGAGKLRLGKQVQRRLIFGAAAGSVAAVVLSQAFAAARQYRDIQNGQSPQLAVNEAAAFLEHATSLDTSVAMHLWGDWAELYWRVPRSSGTFKIPHVLPRELFDQWIDATLSRPPKFIVWDGTPWEPIDGPANGAAVVRLNAMISREYRPIKRIGDLSVFQRIKGA